MCALNLAISVRWKQFLKFLLQGLLEIFGGRGK